MPRRSKIIASGVPLHIIQRGNNRQSCFFADEDYQFYIEWLKEYSQSAGCSIHAYVLMTNHVHLLLSPQKIESVGQRYVQHINRTYKRSGTLWERRFRSSIIQQQDYLFVCQRYIEMNPVRAGIVDHPGEYRWSSYRINGQGDKSDLITHHVLYRNLGHDNEERQFACRGLFRHKLEPGEIDKIRKITNGNFALVSNRFTEEISEMLGRRVTPGKAGRPRKKPVAGKQK